MSEKERTTTRIGAVVRWLLKTYPKPIQRLRLSSTNLGRDLRDSGWSKSGPKLNQLSAESCLTEGQTEAEEELDVPWDRPHDDDDDSEGDDW